MARPNTYPKKTSFPAGAGFLGDSDAGVFFMEANPLLSLAAQNAVDSGVAGSGRVQDDDILRIRALTSGTATPTYTTIAGTYNSESSNPYYKHTSPIFLPDTYKVVFTTGKPIAASVSAIAKVDSSGTFISRLTAGRNASGDYEYTNSTGADIFVSLTANDEEGTAFSDVAIKSAIGVVPLYNKVISNEDEIDSIDRTLYGGEFSPTYTETSGRILADGTIEASYTYTYTSPIKVNKNEVISFVTPNPLAGGVCAFAEVTSNGTFVRRLVLGANASGTYKYEAEENCYVSISANTVSSVKITIGSGLDTIVRGDYAPPQLDAEVGYRWKTDGTSEANASYSRVKCLRMEQGDKISFEAQGAGSIAVVAEVTSAGAWVGVLRYGQNAVAPYEFIAPKDMYISLSYVTTSFDEFVYTKKNLMQKCETIPGNWNKDTHLRFAFITDMHYFGGAGAKVDGLDEDERMQMWVDLINKLNLEKPIDFVMSCGDTLMRYGVSENDAPEQFRKKCLWQLPAPFFTCIGNHDAFSDDTLTKCFGHKREYSFETESFYFIVLDVYSGNVTYHEDYDEDTQTEDTSSPVMGYKYTGVNWSYLTQECEKAVACGKTPVVCMHTLGNYTSADWHTATVFTDDVSKMRTEYYEKYGILLRLFGHQHYYQKSQVGKTIELCPGWFANRSYYTGIEVMMKTPWSVNIVEIENGVMSTTRYIPGHTYSTTGIDVEFYNIDYTNPANDKTTGTIIDTTIVQPMSGMADKVKSVADYDYKTMNNNRQCLIEHIASN